MKELITEILINFWIIVTTLYVAPIMMHKALYCFAKVTYEIHKTRINAKKYERLMKVWRKAYAEI